MERSHLNENKFMVRIIIKGGVWKNTEDEVLKAAVMKYGKNQWARISSLLTRKTPKQCKARWFEWLDPSIKKTEWAKEEDEKLLHMAKLMPTQWRTIAPVVGRTPAQCLERYQKLLDEAEEGEGERGPVGDDVRKLRAGEIDPDPESKPARPDPVDMDEDEKEMLSEARARLANTMGKKAKRKAREKQLEDARRISNLQKKRELKNAGIELKEKKRYKGMDYNADIPFHHPQPAGFFDVNQERLREKDEKRDLSNELRENLDGKRRVDIEEEERKKDFQNKKRKKENGEEYVKMTVDPLQVSDRKRLVLPAPQVTQQDLEEIVKLGASGEVALEMAGSETPSTAFLSEYSLNGPMATRTPRVMTEGGGDILKSMARNLKAITESQTPLLGDEVILEGTIDFKPTPVRALASTPRLLATPQIGGSVRDRMGINTPINQFGDTPNREVAQVQGLKSLFDALPKPKNDFEIVVPDDPLALHSVEDSTVEDSEVLDQRRYALKESRLMEEKRRRSQAVQLDLPRPILTIEKLKMIYSSNSLVAKEKALLLYRDAERFPVEGQKVLPEWLPMEKLDTYIDEAAKMIKEEANLISRDALLIPSLFKDYDYDIANQGFVKVVSEKIYEDQYTHFVQTMKKDALSSQKQEKKLNVTLGGYMNRYKSLNATLQQKFNEIETLKVDLLTFTGLKEMEKEFVTTRIHSESKELERLALMEQDLQDQYRLKTAVE